MYKLIRSERLQRECPSQRGLRPIVGDSVSHRGKESRRVLQKDGEEMFERVSMPRSGEQSSDVAECLRVGCGLQMLCTMEKLLNSCGIRTEFFKISCYKSGFAKSDH